MQRHHASSADVPATSASAAPSSPTAPRGLATTAGALARALRPKQWIKNLLVFAAPGAAGILARGPTLARGATAFAAFCLAASAVYLVNDVVDAPADRLHPSRRRRPVAAGTLPAPVALGAAVVLGAGGLAVAAATGLAFLVVVAAYVLLSISYSLGLKRVAVIDIGIVASGFVLRAVGGGVATGVPNSTWFLMLTSFGSLFVVAGKRYSDLRATAGEEEARTSPAAYTLPYLRYVWTSASAVAVAGYCLWAFSHRGTSHLHLIELSAVPFVLAILRYALLLETDHGGAPEEVLLGDRGMQALALFWLAVYGAGVYLGH